MGSMDVRWFDSAGALKSGGADELPAACLTGWTWIDISGDDAELLSLVETTFDLHPLSIEDVSHPQRRAKLDIFPDSLFVVWLTPVERVDDHIRVEELDIFIGQAYLITIHAAPSEAAQRVAQRLEHLSRVGSDWVLHALIDQIVDSTLPLVDEIGEDLNTIEDAMLTDDPRQDELKELHRVRRQLVHLHRILAPERDVVHGLGRATAVVTDDAYRYFLDVGDHVSRVLDSVETYQDVGASVMDVYLSAQNNRMNEIMKQLTVVATIFMPLTLLSGIYGMNVIVGMWPTVRSPWSFLVVVSSMAIIALVMATYFKRKNWW